MSDRQPKIEYSAKGLVVAIDGPAGVGKSTVAQMVASRLGLKYIDTGAMYRAVTLLALEEGLDLEDNGALAAVAQRAAIEQVYDPDSDIALRTFLCGKDVSKEIRTPRVSSFVSRVSANPAVRKEMVNLQKRLIAEGGVVIEGRDMGTKVAPDADCKVFLTATITERAQRRRGDLSRAGYEVTLDTLKQEITRRDHADSTRVESPLVMARDAWRIDTTSRSAADISDEITQECLKRARKRKRSAQKP